MGIVAHHFNEFGEYGGGRVATLSKRDDIAFAVERNFGVAEQQLNSLKTRWRSLDQGRGGDARLVLPAALSSAAIASLSA